MKINAKFRRDVYHGYDKGKNPELWRIDVPYLNGITWVWRRADLIAGIEQYFQKMLKDESFEFFEAVVEERVIKLTIKEWDEDRVIQLAVERVRFGIPVDEFDERIDMYCDLSENIDLDSVRRCSNAKTTPDHKGVKKAGTPKRTKVIGWLDEDVIVAIKDKTPQEGDWFDYLNNLLRRVFTPEPVGDTPMTRDAQGEFGEEDPEHTLMLCLPGATRLNVWLDDDILQYVRQRTPEKSGWSEHLNTFLRKIYRDEINQAWAEEMMNQCD